MRILLKKARIVAPRQPLNGLTRDLLIEDGIFTEISEQSDAAADLTISEEYLHISPGWMDVFAHFCDPGTEFKEDLRSGAAAAAAGGFTDVMVIPNTVPPLESKGQIEYIIGHSSELPVTIRPIGAVSQAISGKSLAEMYEMHHNGAIAFSDGLRPIQSSGLLLKALQYIKAFNGILIQIPDDTEISRHGLMHEGLWSTRLGMPGIPAIAEEIQLKRDLELLRYSDSRIHFTGLSLGKSVRLIREAKESGLAVSCSVTPYHLMFTDISLQQYDSNYKVSPPLREEQDVQDLRKAIQEGIIDCIATHHFPQDRDSKQKEFEYAGAGMIGLESCFGVLGLALPDMTQEQIVTLLAYNPRQTFGLEVPQIALGSTASLTLFNPHMEWTLEEKHIKSKSRNTPLLGKKLKGKPLGILHKNRFTKS